jgi:hypothetical protein
MTPDEEEAVRELLAAAEAILEADGTETHDESVHMWDALQGGVDVVRSIMPRPKDEPC